MFKKIMLCLSAALGFSQAVSTPVDAPIAPLQGNTNENWPKPPAKAKFKQNQRKQRKASARKKARSSGHA